MPLLLISGYPSSGKTFRSLQLVNFLRTKIESSSDPRISRLAVCHINDQTLGISHSVYQEAQKEKDARAAEYSAVKRHLSKDTIVIADGLNYIKGFRYQLYCEAKSLQTPSCVLTSLEIHIGTQVAKCQEVNRELLEDSKKGEGYAEDIFENLVYRFEEPNGMTRWDSPLFTVLYDDETPPCEEIWEAVIGSKGEAKVDKPNRATVLKPATGSDYLYELDQTSQEILNVILDWQKDHPGEGGGELSIAGNVLQLPTNPVSLPQLQRIRRQFISFNRQHNLPKSRVRSAFIEYLNDNLS